MANRLANEKSPYLLQHKNNPVDWYPWGNEAFEKAKREDKPIFLSVGYSTCHWCHVMERESFEDEEVAALLNKYFVAIKVDREERPDIDHIYMTVCQAMTGSGGWPLTVIMAPDKKPFFAGTYFPKHSHYGRPGLMDVLEQIQEKWNSDKSEIINTGERISEAIKPQFHADSSGKLGEDTFKKARLTLGKNFDPEYGGFGSAPKFPTPHNMAFLLRYWKKTGDQEALAMVEKTLQSMHDGGLYDHLGYGFARYSVDRQWLVPHFEKMLYDNALLAMVYLEAYQITGRELYAGVAQEIFAYVMRDMTSTEGGFYSAEDADSEGVEGKFYVWRPEEIKQVLGEETGDLFCRWYDVTKKGNFEEHSILNRIYANTRDFDPGMGPEEWEKKLAEASQKLFAVREKRIHPHKDDKILTSWNGLMIAAMARGYAVLQDQIYLNASIQAAEFILSRLRNENGRLLARYRDGEPAYLAYIDDYAFLIWAMIELYQADRRPVWLTHALELQEDQNRLFWDAENGGYFFYGSDGEELLARPKEVYDGATPSGNSVAALNLLRLSRITGRNDFASMAETMFESFSGNINGYPAGHTHFLMSFLFATTPGKEVVVVSGRNKADIHRELQSLNRIFSPEAVFLYRLQGEDYRELEAIAPFTRAMPVPDNKTMYYACQNFACGQPVDDLAEVSRILQS
ncbi:MAG: thioredoxin [Peptococcaceae bacterium BRH_c4b]|nr:MAG: thioredoxin [Peptococcaceae bacterium BRH_c4b]